MAFGTPIPSQRRDYSMSIMFQSAYAGNSPSPISITVGWDPDQGSTATSEEMEDMVLGLKEHLESLPAVAYVSLSRTHGLTTTLAA